MLASEAAAAEANGRGYETFESAVDGVALLRSTAGWRSPLTDGELTDLRESAPEGQTWAELVPRDGSEDITEPSVNSVVSNRDYRYIENPKSEVDQNGVASLPADDATIAVRGVRGDQYAVSHGGLGYLPAYRRWNDRALAGVIGETVPATQLSVRRFALPSRMLGN